MPHDTDNNNAEMSRTQRRHQLRDQPESGIGSAFAVNHQVSHGLGAEDAEAQASAARSKVREHYEEEATTTNNEVNDGSEEEEEIPPPDKQEASDKELEQATEMVRLLRSMPSDQRIEAEQRAREEQARKQMEAELDAISIEDLAFRNYTRQTIPVFGGRVRIVFQSLQGIHYAAMRRWSGTFLTRELKLPQDLINKTQGVLSTACGIVEISSDHEQERPPGEWPAETGFYSSDRDFRVYHQFFMDRLNWILEKPLPMQRMLNIQFTWFEQRINRAYNEEAYVVQEIKKS